MGDYSSGTDGSAGYRYKMSKFDLAVDGVKAFINEYPEMGRHVLKTVEEFVNDYYKEKENEI